MNAQTERFDEDEYEEYDEFDDDEDGGERGLSGLVVLLMGIVMLGAFASVVWIAYQQGVKTGGVEAAKGGAPLVAAEPGPVKIENTDAANAKTTEASVYDKFDGQKPAPTETLAAKPEEPVDRTSADPIASIATKNDAGSSNVVDDAVADRIRSLAVTDDASGAQSEPAAPAPSSIHDAPAATANPAPAKAVPAQPANATASSEPPAPAPSSSAPSGTHVVQVAAVGSQAEADQTWARLQKKLGDYLAGKSEDVERADLGSKGVYYRVRIGSFTSADAAKTYCEGLKSRGQDCLVKAK